VRIGVPRERKNNEFRVAMRPAGVHQLVESGHQVLVESGAGEGSRITDPEFESAGAKLLDDAAELWSAAELIVKVKEPIPAEFPLLRPDLTLFTYLHLAADRALTERLMAAGTTAIGYETVQLSDGSLPLLAPMSEIAGRLAPQVGAHHLMRSSGGRGVLLGGVPGVDRAAVVILGGGMAGSHAAAIALGMRADVTVLDVSAAALNRLDVRFGGAVRTIASTPLAIAERLVRADLVIGAVLVPGARAPKLVSNDVVAAMPSGSVLVDIAIDQGGCFADSRPTTHDEPTFAVHNSLFYCVTNMPGAVPRTATFALTNATLPYVRALADRGVAAALEADPALARGLNTAGGEVLNGPVAAAHGLPARA
jgi:alanine dehydrogenase